VNDVLWFIAGQLVGVFLTVWLTAELRRIVQTGRVGTVPRAATHTPGLSPEVSAQFKISGAMLDAATEDLVRQAAAAGRQLDRKAARKQAEKMLDSIMNDWTGGIPNG
jgi:hypothetical protein